MWLDLLAVGTSLPSVCTQYACMSSDDLVWLLLWGFKVFVLTAPLARTRNSACRSCVRALGHAALHTHPHPPRGSARVVTAQVFSSVFARRPAPWSLLTTHLAGESLRLIQGQVVLGNIDRQYTAPYLRKVEARVRPTFG